MKRMSIGTKKTLLVRAEILTMVAVGSYIVYWLITNVVWGWYLILTGR